MFTRAKLFGALLTTVTRITFQVRLDSGQTRRGSNVSAPPSDHERDARSTPATSPLGKPKQILDAALRAGKATKQAAILNALPAHIPLLDTQGQILSANEAWRRFGSAHAILSLP